VADLVNGTYLMESMQLAGEQRRPIGLASCDRPPSGLASRINKTAALALVVLCSIGLWAAIWAVLASLLSAWL
jgi:hypothetical protein